MKRNKYEMWDSDIVWDYIRGALICSWLGHKWKPKMYDDLCTRCSTSRPRRREA